MKPEERRNYDVLIIGGGIAGSVAAWSFSRSGLSVALIDERDMAAPFFRAERISSLAIRELTKFGLGEIIDRVALPLPDTAVIKGSKVERISEEVDFSIPLWTLVNEIRDELKSGGKVDFISDQVDQANTGPAMQSVHLKKSGEEITGKLLVVATGVSTVFLKMIGVSREIISKNHSSTFGFDIEPGEKLNLPASSATVRICKHDADYMNIFPTQEGGHRANLFTYWPAGDARQREFLKGDSTAVLKRLAPKLMELTGEFEIKGPIDCGSVSVMKSTNFRRPGFVLIGDAYGRICPCAGRGINKVISDVQALEGLVPKWIEENADLTPELLDSYYHDNKREAFEEWVFEESLTLRERIVASSPKQLLRRIMYHHVPPALQDMYWKLWGSRKKAQTAPT